MQSGDIYVNDYGVKITVDNISENNILFLIHDVCNHSIIHYNTTDPETFFKFIKNNNYKKA